MTDSINIERKGGPAPDAQKAEGHLQSQRKQGRTRLLARVMTIAGWTGLGLSLLFLICMPVALHRLNTGISAELEALAASLRKASNSLEVQDKNIDQLDELLDIGAGLSAEMDDSLAAVTPLLDDMAAFLGDQMPLTLVATESSLRSASEGAAAIDALLRILTRIPFIGSIEYDPDQPLDASLVQAADGLVPLSEPLVELQRDLNEFSLSLTDLHTEISGSEARLTLLRGKLAGIQETIRIGGDRLVGLANAAEGVVERLPGIAVMLGILLGIFAVWLMLLNVVLILQGRLWSTQLDSG